jgi:hypothetical protein
MVFTVVALPVQDPGQTPLKGFMCFRPRVGLFISGGGSPTLGEHRVPLNPDGTFSKTLEWKDGLEYDVRFDGRKGVWPDFTFRCGTDPGEVADGSINDIANLTPVSVPSTASAPVYTRGPTGSQGPQGDGVSGIQTTLAKIATASQDVHIACLDDSTSASSSLWFGRIPAHIGAAWPEHTIKYREWDSGVTQAWTAYNTIQTGTNGRTIHFHNGSVGGQTWAYPQRNRLAPMVGDVQPDLIFTSYLYNSDWDTEAQSSRWMAELAALTESLLLASPGSAIVCLGKPGKTANESVAYRDARLRELARVKGFGYVDLRAAFDAVDPDWRTNLVQVDGIHPTTGIDTLPPSGQDVILAEVLTHFTYVRRSQVQSQGASTLTVPTSNLLLNGSFATWPGSSPTSWTPTNTTPAKDTTWFETGADALRIVPTAAGAAYVQQDLSAVPLRGQWVTCAARVRIPTGASVPSGNGLVQMLDGATIALCSSIYSPGVTDTDGFGWVAVSMKVHPAATTLSVFVVGTLTGGAGNEATFDRVVLCKGTLPRDMF